MEARFCSDQDSQADTGSVAYQTRGLGKWITASAQTDLPVDSRYLTPSASIDGTATASLQDSNLQNVFASIYGQTGQIKDFVMLAGSTFKIAITSLSQFNKGVTSSAPFLANVRLFQQSGDAKKITTTVDVYEGDFGQITIHPTPFNAYDAGKGTATNLCRAYVLDMSNVEIAFNRLPRLKQLEDRGGGPRGFVDAITVLKVYNPLSLAKFNPTA
jgi:hypothetical protein